MIRVHHGCRWRLSVLLAMAGCLLLARPAPSQVFGDAAEAATLRLSTGQSQTVRTPWRLRRVSVTEPTIADVQIISPTEALVLGKQVGATDLLLWGEAEEEAMRIRLQVDIDLERLKADLARYFPQSQLELTQSQGIYILSGQVRAIEHMAQLQRFLEATGLPFINMSSLAGVQQVNLRVRMAEVSRNAIQALGVNFFRFGDDFFGASTIGPSAGGPLVPMPIGAPEGASATGNVPFVVGEGGIAGSPLVTLIAGFPRADLQFFIQALAENQYLRVLAEPSLVALSGEEASFLAGGEFPIPVVQSLGGTGTSISIEYKEFGIRLNFLPVVTGDGAIKLRVAPEVSELSDIGAVELQGFRVPSVVTRRTETTVNMRSGQTFGIAGLLSNNTRARSSRVPGLGDLPVLGTLFRSVRYEQGETELVVLVTATMVEPMDLAGEPALVGADHRPPDPWELYFEGRIAGREPIQQNLAGEDLRRGRELGFHQLRGPGAWAAYDDPPQRGRLPARLALRDEQTAPAVIEAVQPIAVTNP